MHKIRFAFLFSFILLTGSITTMLAQSFGGCNFGLADLTNCTLHYTNPPNPPINIPWTMAVGTCSNTSAPGAPYALTSVTIDGVTYSPIPFFGVSISPYGKVTVTSTGMSIVP